MLSSAFTLSPQGHPLNKLLKLLEAYESVFSSVLFGAWPIGGDIVPQKG